MTQGKEAADWVRIVTLVSGDIVVIDTAGHPQRFTTLAAYEVFCAGIQQMGQSLWDAIEDGWAFEPLPEGQVAT